MTNKFEEKETDIIRIKPDNKTLAAILHLAIECKQHPDEALTQTLGNIYMAIEEGEYESTGYENELCNLVQDLHAYIEGDDR